MLSKSFSRTDGSWPSAFDRGFRWLVAATAFAAGTFCRSAEHHRVLAQTTPVGDAATAAMPQPIYWKQSLFQIPYQWGSAAEPGAAIAVRLFASKDRGSTWQQITEAKPNVTSFSYRAEGEGEYWFAVRTLDRNGRTWPAGPFRPELSVIVDTTMPQISGLRALQQPNGTIEIEWSGQDLHLDPATWAIEIQCEPNGAWLPAPNTGASVGLAAQPLPSNSTNSGRLTYRPPIGAAPTAVRARVQDLAGNAATFVTRIEAAPPTSMIPSAVPVGTMQRLPVATQPVALTTDHVVENPFLAASGPLASNAVPAATPPASASPTIPNSSSSQSTPPGWVGSAGGAASGIAGMQPQDQNWPVDSISRAPLRLWHGSQRAPNDSITTYGNPSGIMSPTVTGGGYNRSTSEAASSGTSAQYATAGGPRLADSLSPPGSQSPVQPQSPFRQAAVERLPEANRNLLGDDKAVPPVVQFENTDSLQAGTRDRQLPPGGEPKLVGSRTFALEYEIEEAGRVGISAVELWGTNDGGQSWRMYTRDDDNRTPLIVTVDGEGVYGFRIVIASASGEAPFRPVAGDQPELWVAVDLHRPVAELTSVEVGTGNLADHLKLRWQAMDDNLDSRPISLFYSSRPGGPWSSISTSLENTGEYSWRVERHVPTRFYVRLEARDSAGNVAAFETRDPIEFSPPVPSGQLRSAVPAGPATGAAYR